jgi:hypothetical protein
MACSSPSSQCPLENKQQVKLRVDTEDGLESGPPAWEEEMAWIGKNAHLYKGEYVAV